MKTIVTVLRWLIAVPLFCILAAFFIASTVGVAAFTIVSDSDNPKEWIRESGIYDDAVDIGVGTFLLYTKEKAGTDGTMEGLSRGMLNTELVTRQLDEVFPPDWIQAQVERTIDSAYAFLKEDTTSLKIRLDFSGREETARAALGNIFKERVASLPLCERNVIGSIKTIDLFSMSCLPQNLSKAALFQYIDSTLEETNPFFDPTFGLTQFERDLTDSAEPVLRIVSVTPLVVLFLVALSSFLVTLFYFTVPGSRSKAIALAILFGSMSLVAIGAGATGTANFDALYSQYISVHIPMEAESVQPYLKNAVESITRDVATALFVFGALYLLITLLFVLLAVRMGREDTKRHARYCFMTLLLASLIATLLCGLSIVLSFQTLELV